MLFINSEVYLTCIKFYLGELLKCVISRNVIEISGLSQRIIFKHVISLFIKNTSQVPDVQMSRLLKCTMSSLEYYQRMSYECL